MNQSFLNPFATAAIPESVHQIIGPTTEVSSLCARFNPKGKFAGQYIASARADCAVAIYDLETRGMVRYLEAHVKPVTWIAWSDTGRFLASASADWNVVVWDLKQIPAARVATLRFDAPISQVSFAPASSRLLLVTLDSQQVVLVDLRRRKRRKMSTPTTSAAGEGHTTNGINGNSEGHQSQHRPHSNGSHPTTSSLAKWQSAEVRTDLAQVYKKMQQQQAAGQEASTSTDALPPLTCAQFHPSGSFILAGTTRGEILAFSVVDGCRLISRINAAGSSAIREIAFDRSGRGLVVNSNDRSIRVLSVEVDSSDALPTLRLNVIHRFVDLVNRTPWSGIGFSGDGEYVYAGAAHKAAHNVYIWDRGAGALDKILEGPREPLVDVHWHPIRPLLLSVSVSGPINIWFTPNAENWSAYAPGFEELEENLEYQEGEEEFDLEDEDELSRRKQDQEDVVVDVMTFGPAPGGSGPKVDQTVCDARGQGVAPDQGIAASGQGNYEYEWVDDPEYQGEDIALYPQLEEDVLDEDEGNDGHGL